MTRSHGLAAVLAWVLVGSAPAPARAQAGEATQLDSATRICAGSVTEECIVRQFKDSKEASIIRGRLVFQNYCVLCHGPEGRGDGRAAKLHTPRPFNLTTSTAPDYYVAQMIRKGGEAMGRGKGMPPWGEQLTDEQIKDLISFLFTLRVPQ